MKIHTIRTEQMYRPILGFYVCEREKVFLINKILLPLSRISFFQHHAFLCLRLVHFWVCILMYFCCRETDYYSYKYAFRQFELNWMRETDTRGEAHIELSLANAHVYVVFTILIAAPILTAPQSTHTVVNK